MLIYDNGCFKIGEVSFQLPNGVGIDTNSDELCGEGFHLYASDKSFSVQIDFKESDKNAYDAITRNFLPPFNYRKSGEVGAISVSGLRGYKAHFEDDKSYHEEYIFDLINCEARLLDIYVLIPRKGGYDEALKCRIVSEILESIKCNIE